VYFLPWIGTEYKEQPARLLLLGESHYGDDPAIWATDPQLATIECTQAYVDGLWRHRYWTNIMKVVEGGNYWEIDRVIFWSKVSLYNYIQRLVSEEPGVAPTEHMWRDATQGFGSVLQHLDPTHILVLSKRLWDRLPQDSYRSESTIVCNGHTREIRKFYFGPQGVAIATCLPHPSYHFHFNAKILHPLVRAFLNSNQ
jgi:hypothetical protein